MRWAVRLSHACALAQSQSHVPTHTHVLSHTHSCLTYSRVCSHTCVLSHALACSHTLTRALTHTRVLTCSHTHVLRAGTDKAASLPLVPWKDVAGPQSGEGAGPLLAPPLLGCPSSQGFHSRSLGVRGWPQPRRAPPAGRGRSSLSRVPTQFCLPELAALPPNHQAHCPQWPGNSGQGCFLEHHSFEKARDMNWLCKQGWWAPHAVSRPQG